MQVLKNAFRATLETHPSAPPPEAWRMVPPCKLVAMNSFNPMFNEIAGYELEHSAVCFSKSNVEMVVVLRIDINEIISGCLSYAWNTIYNETCSFP